MTTKYAGPLKEFIDSFWKKYFKAPTLDEISEGLGGVSKSVIHYSLENDLGYKNPVKGSSRWITPQWVKDAITQYEEPK